MLLEECEQSRCGTRRNLASRFFAAESKIQLNSVKKTDSDVFRLPDEKPQIIAGIRFGGVEFQQRPVISVDRARHESQPLLA
jgi:hypothetical protein